MVKKIYSLCFVFVCIISLGQTNIVPNSSFETNTICPDYPGQINYATGWNNVNLTYNNFTVGSPDYFHACGSASLGYNTVPPNIFDGVCQPHTGNGFAGTILYNVPYPDYREYMSIQLTQAMTPGNTYTVSFWITNGNPPKSPYIIKNIGAHLSATPLNQSGWNVINMAPTCEITNYSGSNSWVNYTFTVNPASNLNYITVGSFRNDLTNAPTSTYTGTSGPDAAYGSYFWDDIEVWAPSGGLGTGLKEISLRENDLRIFPNPTSSGLINISSSNSIDEVKIFNHTGSNVKSSFLSKNGVGYSLGIDDLSSGIYFLQFFSKNELVCAKKLVKQ